ncbi:FAD:protein FMN transferase [Microbacterium nymphoidis]|uniref:FAD:protein FMN transferase n=1 Tax=Microbacterium nymphoidis TaxID=2898586 RepID=UPI001E514DBD|nr:FAD:protein FMN transferase [Microbacterium nymphoidis]MCD2499469.1 FAD:protein FMN transferase [Microbacterium nymphoidis]
MSADASWRFDAIGTAWTIRTERDLPEPLRADVLSLIDAFDREWSRFRSDSLVTALAGGGRAAAPVDAAPMFEVYRELAEATDDAVNPLIGGSLEALGYGVRPGTPGRAMPAPSWRDALHWDGGALVLSAPAVIDVGALGKGRLADRVFALIRSRTPGTVIVDASGDIRLDAAEETVRIALEHPYDPTRAIGVATLSSGAVCASATNRRVWGDGLHHVLDGRTGLPVDVVVATWAFLPDAMHADALATALFFDGGLELAHAWGAQWIRVLSDGRAEHQLTDANIELFR